MFKAIGKVSGNLLRGGLRALADKLDEVIDVVNSTQQINGDPFILVNHIPGIGLTLGLNIAAVIARIPKQSWNGIQLVALANPTGSFGSNSTPSAPTLVYDISNPATGTTLATAVPVLFARQLGHVTAGTWGLAQLVATTVGGTPAWQLYVVDEVYDAVEACS